MTGLPAIRALYKTWGRVAVLHFDSHLDSWDPKQLGGGASKYSEITHGSMFHIAHEEGLLSKDRNMHLGSRSMLFDKHFDLDNDARCGFSYIRARELDLIGVEKVIQKIVKTVGDDYVYLSIDIDVLDPGSSPRMLFKPHSDIKTQRLRQRLEPSSQEGGRRGSCFVYLTACRRQVLRS